jgi:SAM-dependent methyltransferase
MNKKPEIRTTAQIRARLPALREELKVAGFDFKHLSRVAEAAGGGGGGEGPPSKEGSLARELPIVIDEETPLTEEAGVSPKLRHLLRLFQLHEPIERAELESVFSSSTIGTLVMTGLVSEDGGGATFRSNVFLTAWHHDLLLVSDRLDQTEDLDSIFPPGPSTSAVAFYLPRHVRPKRIVDVGTGGGALALLAARLYGRESDVKILAVDPNKRAVDACNFNAALNGISSSSSLVEAHVADHEEIIKTHDRNIDLFLWNMPLAWAPDNFALTYDGEKMMEQIYEALPRILTPKTGHAALRHDARLGKEWFSEWIRARGDLPEFQALLRRESETARANRPFPQQEDGGVPYLLCVSLISPASAGGEPAALLDFDAWSEALFETSKSDWQTRIQSVPGWSSYSIAE